MDILYDSSKSGSTAKQETYLIPKPRQYSQRAVESSHQLHITPEISVIDPSVTHFGQSQNKKYSITFVELSPIMLKHIQTL